MEAANQPKSPREVIVGDITYLPTRVGRWSYLASWQDKFSKRIVGWAVEDAMTDELVSKALEKALAGGAIKAGTIIHTGAREPVCVKELPCHARREWMPPKHVAARASASDNAQAESFFSRFKAELLEDGVFECVEQARSETFSYREGYYNRVRRHSALGYKSPAEFERDFNTPKKGRSSENFLSGIT